MKRISGNALCGDIKRVLAKKELAEGEKLKRISLAVALYQQWNKELQKKEIV